MQEIMPFVSAHPMLCLAWVALFVAVIVATVKNRFSKVNEISRGEAIRLINKEDAVVVDLRSRDDYRKGHIANALNLTPAEIKNGSLGELDKAKSKPVIVVCATGSTSREPADKLNKTGFERVYVLKEGVSGWSGENLPLVRGK